MKMLSIIASFFTLSSMLIVSLGSCGQGSGADSAAADSKSAKSGAGLSQLPLGYDLADPVVFEMPEELTEVSGISFYRGDPAVLYAEQDEKGRLYWLKPGDQQVNYIDFGKDGDYEDLAFTSHKVVLLKSNGSLYEFDFTPLPGGGAAPVTGKVEQWKDLLPKGEYEGLYADTGNNQLYVLCKECANEDHKKQVSIYRLDSHAEGWSLGETSQIDVTRISDLAAALNPGDKARKINFKPSAISRNPLTGEWYVLSSVNKMLVVAGADWQVKAVYPLKNKLYTQPEGMCFDKDHNLYISNEGPKGGKGNVLKFIRKTN